MSTWIVATSPQVAGLVEKARAVGAPVEVIVVGDRSTADALAASGVDGVIWVETIAGTPVEAAARTVADLAADAGPSVVVSGTDGGSKVLAGAIAARTGAEVIPGVTGVRAAEAGVTVESAGLGGIVDITATWTSPVLLLADAGTEVEPTADRVDVKPVTLNALEMSSVEQNVEAAEHGDLAAAKRIVAVGRGLKAREDLRLIEDLATALDAEVACSRPLAEGLDWLPKDSYVGVSGAHVAPELYVAVGISGQLQHMSGVKGAKTVVAINSDKDAPVFSQSDYGVVGDLYSVVPALTAAVRG